MTKQWQQPAGWEDFEEMCFRLAVAEGTEVMLHKYGRRGQEQNGVDIVGHSASSRSEWVGYQCKLKTEHLGSKLQQAEIIEEYEKSKNFYPPLTRLIFATTSPRDNAAQNVINQHNAAAHRRHELGIWWWEDIASLLDKHSAVAARFYPNFFDDEYIQNDGTTISTSLAAGAKYINGRIKKFFEHQLFQARFGSASKQVTSAILEVVSNVFSPSKGGALRVELDFDGELLRIADNGITFNPFDMTFEPHENQCGIRMIRSVREVTGLEVIYQSKQPHLGTNLNELIVRIIKPFDREQAFTCSQHIKAADLFFRSDVIHFVESLNIPNECNPYTLLIGPQTAGISISASHQLLYQIRQRLGSRKLRIIVSGKIYSFLIEELRSFARRDGSVEILQDDS